MGVWWVLDLDLQRGFLRVLDRPEELEQGAVVYFDVPVRYAREPEGMALQS